MALSSETANVDRGARRGRWVAAVALVLQVAAIPFFFAWSTIAYFFYVFTFIGVLAGVVGVWMIATGLRYHAASRVALLLGALIPVVSFVVLSGVLSDGRPGTRPGDSDPSDPE